jgi:hypothetical protein
MYAHSKCCDAHWELCHDMHTKRWFLACEKCEKEIGNIFISGPEIDGKCACCEKESNEKGA